MIGSFQSPPKPRVWRSVYGSRWGKNWWLHRCLARLTPLERSSINSSPPTPLSNNRGEFLFRPSFSDLDEYRPYNITTGLEGDSIAVSMPRLTWVKELPQRTGIVIPSDVQPHTRLNKQLHPTYQWKSINPKSPRRLDNWTVRSLAEAWTKDD